MDEVTTLPQGCRAWPESVDVVRSVIRRHPGLRSLGRVVGATRLYTPAELEQIRVAMEARRTRRTPAAAG